MKKTCQVIQLPTTSGKDLSEWISNHLYFVSDEEIKEGDVFSRADNHCIYDNNRKGYYKIIATTDKSLNLPLIPQSFIEEYVKQQGGIKEIDYIVNQTLHNGDEIGIQYKNTIYYIKGKLAVEYLLSNQTQDYIKLVEESENKQTVEQAAEEVSNSRYDEEEIGNKRSVFNAGFLLGANWQKQQYNS